MKSSLKKLIIIVPIIMCSCVNSINTIITNESYSPVSVSVFLNKDFIKFTGENTFFKMSKRNTDNITAIDSSNFIITYTFASRESLTLDFGIRQSKDIIIICDSILCLRESDSIIIINKDLEEVLFINKAEVLENRQTKDIKIKDEYFKK